MLLNDQSHSLSIGNHPPYHYLAKGGIYEVWNSVPSSPISSTSAATFDDIEVQDIFNENSNHLLPNYSTRPDLSLFEGDSPDFVSMFEPLPEDLNPHATPFVPKQPPPKSRQLLRPDPGTMLQPRMDRWRRTFNLATRPPIEDKDIQSLIIVAAEAWTSDQLAELAQEFCWRCAEATQDDLEAILTFMMRLYWQFKRMKSEEIANIFEWHLKEVLLGTFTSVWDANTNKEAISYQYADSQVIGSGVMLAVAIGKLFRKGFFDTKDIHICLRALMSNFISVEHADAVDAMFYHIGPNYWYTHPDGIGHLKEFQYSFGCIMQKLEGKMSVLNHPRTEDDLSTIMNGVAKQCMELHEQMTLNATQAPSQIETYMQPPPIPTHSEDPVHFAGPVPPRFGTQALHHVGQGYQGRRR